MSPAAFMRGVTPLASDWSVGIGLVPVGPVDLAEFEEFVAVEGDGLVDDGVPARFLDHLVAVEVAGLELLEEGVGLAGLDHLPVTVFLPRSWLTEYGYSTFLSSSSFSAEPASPISTIINPNYRYHDQLSIADLLDLYLVPL